MNTLLLSRTRLVLWETPCWFRGLSQDLNLVTGRYFGKIDDGSVGGRGQLLPGPTGLQSKVRGRYARSFDVQLRNRRH